MSKLLKRIIALILVLILVSANMMILGEYTIAYALSDEELNEQTATTNHKNVEFNSYFNGESHNQTFDINSDDSKIYLKIKINSAGYLQNGTIEFLNTNFKLKDGITNENIQSVDTENNKISLNRLNNGSDITIELPIEILKNEDVSLDYFSKETITKFTGTYTDGNGEENSIEKEVTNKLSWAGNAETELTIEVNKYVPYATDGNYGAMVQAKIKSNVKDATFPIKSTNIEVTVPTLNATKPTSVNVIATTTSATNGKTDGLDFTSANYTYDQENGKVIINTSNLDDSISWKEGTSDEYLVTFLFEGRDIYNYASENGIDSSITANSNITIYNNEENTINNTASADVKFTEREGTVADFAISSSSDISKGYLYTNYETTNKVETEYYTKYTATVNSAKLTTSIEFTQGYDVFLTEDESEFPTTVGNNNYAYNKRVEISQEIFNKMLGEDGEIIVKTSDGTELGKINKDSTLENGNYILDISEKDNNKLVITTSAPITEGQIEINIVKALKGNMSYSKDQMKTFEKIKVDLEGKTNTTTFTAWRQILLKEPETKVELSISKKDLTTVVTNENVEIRAVLDTSSEYNALFNNPTLEITLPSYIEDVNLKSADILLANGLKIKDTDVTEKSGHKVITIILEGNQTEYAIDAEYKGAIIVLNTDLTTDTLTPSGKDKITMKYTNENDTATKAEGTIEVEVNFVAPNGVVAANGISNYKDGADSVLSISDEPKTVEIDTYSEKRVATMNSSIINNYPNDIGNIVILGRIPSKGNQRIDTDTNLGSSFDTSLATEIGISEENDSNYKVYYSDNPNATRDINDGNNNWTEELTTLSKSFLIVFEDDYKMSAGEKIDFTYNIEIPADIAPNNSAYGMYKVYYNNEANIGAIPESKDSAIIGIITESGPELSADIRATINTVREGQIVKMIVTVKNSGTQIANNVKLRIPVPEYSSFVDFYVASEFKPSEDEVRTIDVGTVNPNEEVEIPYYIKIDNYTDKNASEDMTDEELNDVAESNKFPKEIVHSLEILTDDIKNPIPSNQYIMKVDDGKMKIDLIGHVEETKVLKAGEEIEYTIRLSNIADLETIENTIVTIELPEGMEFISAVVKNQLPDEEEITDGVSFDESRNTLQVGVGTLETVKYIILKTRVTEFTGNMRMLVTAVADNIEEHYSNVFEHSSEKVNLQISELTSSPKYVKEEENITYKFSVTNAGRSTATNVNIIDELPEGLEFVEATYRYNNGDNVKVTTLQDGKLLISLNQMNPNTTTEVTIIAKANLLSDRNDKEVRNKIIVQADTISDIESNEVINIIEYNEDIDHPGTDNPGGEENRYRITGTAWIDSNQNGRRDTDEATAPGIDVYLLDKINNVIVRDIDTNEEKITETSETGVYEFNNLEPGEYVVIFVYDSSRYSLTKYQAEEVDSSLNSDTIDINITLDGERRIAAITDTIVIVDENARDIDIGIYESEKFDLRIDKYIDKVTLSTPTIGTRVDEHNDLKVARVEVLGSNLGKSTAVIEYSIVVTNEGNVSGYARTIVDYLPEEFSFSTELNNDWYLSDNGNIYNSSLENIRIEPGESQEVKLILSVNITEDKLGVVRNTAELYETYNEQGLQDIDSIQANQVSNEDDISNAELVLGLVTGKIVGYTILTITVITILGVGIYEIRKHVLNKKG